MATTLDNDGRSSLNGTPAGNRVRIAFFGLRNAGKSTLVNAFCRQEVAIVSDVPGTTTDPVSKAMEIIRSLGLTDALDPAFADFTPLTTGRDDLYLSAAEHAAKVEIDEQGVTGAAYTALDMATGAPEPDDEIDFVLDRPFLFLITGRDGSVLFSGIIRNIG